MLYRTGMEVLDLIISTGVPVTWDNLRPVAESVLASRGETTLIVSDLATRAAAAVLGAFRGLPPGAAGLASDRFELTIGEPEQWVPGHPDHKAIRARARHILPL